MEINSPLQEIKYKGHTIFVKRDDMIDPYISGNKWRKLKYILEAARLENKLHLVTFGGAFSNHIVATAAAAHRNGLISTAFIRGEAVENDVLSICKDFGMHLIFVSREAYKDKHLLFKMYFGDDTNAFFINEGGAGKEGMKGCSELIDELPADFDHIFCAAGTGTTSAGLLAGLSRHQLNTLLHVVPVLKGGDFIKDEIQQLTGHTDQLILHTDFHFGGYAKTMPGLISFMKAFTAETSIPLDPVYTGKMFFAIFQLLDQNHFKMPSKILAIHTGGLLGILGMKEKFDSPL